MAMSHRAAITLSLFAAMLAGGCSSYAVPGRGADMAAFGLSPQTRAALTDSTVQEKLDRKPLARFPSAIAVVRVQSPHYRSHTAESWGSGRYSVVTTRDVETEEQVQRLARLPLVTGIATVNRLLLPEQLNSDLELRQAAAALHADLLLLYTLDTVFSKDDFAPPLSVVTLGLSPNKVAKVSTTASAVLLDTRNGYLYAVAEATSKSDQLANAWTDEQAVDDARRRTESAAFDKLVNDFGRAWGQVVNQYATRR